MRDTFTGIPESFGGAEWKDVTNLHPVGLIAVLALGICLISVPRRYAVLPMMIMACFVPSVQKIVIFSLDFNLVRVMVLFGIGRLLLRRETKGMKRTTTDNLILLWIASTVIMQVLQVSTFSVFNYPGGLAISLV